jgi:nucleotide-binding universal stress UspA family protein
MRAETESALSALPNNVKHRIHLEMGVGRIADHLLALANEEQVDVIVLGTHRRRALGRLFSVSHHVLALAPMAVACIPATAVVPDLSTVASFHTALAATDFSRAGNRAVTCALGVVAHGTVHVVHVSNEPFSPGHEAAQLKKLAEALPPDAERNGARVMVHVLHGEVASEILKATDKLGAEVVCLGVKAETMLKSAVLTEVIRRSGRPVLIAPPVKA